MFFPGVDLGWGMGQNYLDVLVAVDRARHLFFDVVDSELHKLKVYEVTSAQLMLMYNIGSEQITTGSLIDRGFYCGSNPAYNIRKLVDGGYITQSRSVHDHRNTMIKLSLKGLTLCERVEQGFSSHVEQLLDEQRHFVPNVSGEMFSVLQGLLQKFSPINGKRSGVTER